MEMKIDLRILTLKKLTLSSAKDDKYVSENEKENKRYVSAHYFDYLDFTHVHLDDAKDYLNKAYEAIKKIRANNNHMQTKILQSIIMFQYLDEKTGSLKNIEAFWEKRSTHIFVSMIKLLNTTNFDSIKQAKEKICRILDKGGISKTNYTIYYTFDFSDLILLVKDVSIHTYQDVLWEINFTPPVKKCGSISDDYSDKYTKFVRDTLTLFGIDFECFKSIANTDTLSHQPENLGVLSSDTINATISLGIQDPSLFRNVEKTITKELSLSKENYTISVLFGRRDIKIELRDITIANTIKLYGRLKDISSNCSNPSNRFLGMKIITSVSKSTLIDEYLNSDSIENDAAENPYKKLLDSMSTLVQAYSKEQDKQNDYMNVNEIYDSLIELSSNYFSDEFLVSVYYSFYVFLKICLDRIKHQIENDPDNIDQEIIVFQREYISCLNMLSHCTMHGEKCFIQAAPFNSLLIDVPPKMLAFYSSLALRIKQILQQDEDQLFTFLFVPDLKSSINVKPISSGGDTDNRLLAVFINEERLYDPYRVVCSMVHEIAHFVGNETRCRIERLDCIIKTFLHSYFYMCFSKPGSGKLADAFTEILKEKITELSVDNCQNKYYLSLITDYFVDNTFYISDILDTEKCPERFVVDTDISDYISTENLYYDVLGKMCSDPYNIKVCSDIVFKIMHDELFSFFEDSHSENFANINEQVIGSYKEAYADLVLCMLTEIPLDQYVAQIVKEASIKKELEPTEITTELLYELNQNGIINLEMSLRLNAIITVCYSKSESLCSEEANMSKKVYNIMSKYLIDYLKVCQKKLTEILTDESRDVSLIITKLKNMDKEDAFGLICNEIHNFNVMAEKVIENQN